MLVTCLPARRGDHLESQLDFMTGFLRFVFLIFLLVQLVQFDKFEEIIPQAYAQEFNAGIAKTHNVTEKEAIDGDIVSIATVSGIFNLSRTSYDEKIFGVIVMNPILVYRTPSENTPIIRQGEVMVNVTTLNGPIASGNFITSSAIPGKGQKATDPTGAVLGMALDKFDDSDGTKIDFGGKKYSSGKIKVAVAIQSPAVVKPKGGIMGTLESFSFVLFKSLQQSAGSDRLIRYIIAGLIASLTVLVNFESFGKNITKGIEAIGRNPLAKVSIQSMILMNIILIAVVSIGGVILSLAIISF